MTGLRKLVLAAFLLAAHSALGRDVAQASGDTCKNECYYCNVFLGGTFYTTTCDDNYCLAYCYITETDYSVFPCQVPSSFSPACS